MLNLNQTIVAGSSPPGRSLRALIRLSGPQAGSILGQMLEDDTRQSLIFDSPPRKLNTFRIRPSKSSDPLPVLACLFAAPHSYTGQDLIEIQVPGNPALLNMLIQRAIELGAAPAQPGELTFRAYLAGKMDLTQAEGVAATVSAVSDAQLHAATLLRQGQLGRFASDLVNQMANSLALVEAGIDFTDQEDVVPVTPADLDASLTGIESRLKQFLLRCGSMGQLQDLPHVVLVGPPSSGKSTLFNALIGRARAIVHDLPGTTRDVLAEPLKLIDANDRPVEVMLLDIAGLDTPYSALDHSIQESAQAAINRADLVLVLNDGREDGEQCAIETPGPAEVLNVASKSDVGRKKSPADSIAVSALTGEGLDELKRIIVDRLGDRAVGVTSQMLALGPRHEAALDHALGYINQARALLQPQLKNHSLNQMELVAGALRGALDELTCLGGQMTPDDVIGRIFATFCIGK